MVTIWQKILFKKSNYPELVEKPCKGCGVAVLVTRNSTDCVFCQKCIENRNIYDVPAGR